MRLSHNLLLLAAILRGSLAAWWMGPNCVNETSTAMGWDATGTQTKKYLSKVCNEANYFFEVAANEYWKLDHEQFTADQRDFMLFCAWGSLLSDESFDEVTFALARVGIDNLPNINKQIALQQVYRGLGLPRYTNVPAVIQGCAKTKEMWEGDVVASSASGSAGDIV